MEPFTNAADLRVGDLVEIVAVHNAPAGVGEGRRCRVTKTGTVAMGAWAQFDFDEHLETRDYGEGATVRVRLVERGDVDKLAADITVLAQMERVSTINANEARMAARRAADVEAEAGRQLHMAESVLLEVLRQRVPKA